jgi:hypothetical protein
LLILLIWLARFILPSIKKSKADLYLAVGIAGVAIALLTVVSLFYRKLDAIALIVAVIATGILGVLFSTRRPS